eukprot:scaffold1194_cov369-Prasinococcus_capsulatus_cf.AAC.21
MCLASCSERTLHGIVGTLIGAIQIPGREKRGQPAEASALDSIVRANKVDGRALRRSIARETGRIPARRKQS